MTKISDLNHKAIAYLKAAFYKVPERARLLVPAAKTQQRLKRAGRKLAMIAGTLLILLLVFWLFVYMVPVTQEWFVKQAPSPKSNAEISPKLKKALESSQKELQNLNKKYEAMTPKQAYMVINTSDNHFFLYRDRKLVREGFVSTGSYVRLQSHDDREWLFKTPKGKQTVKGKITNPVWRRPDWAFIEEGLAVPSATHPSRYEYGVLGDYALSLGDGYLIHGTLYKRFLGMPVTHGCIRMNDEDLEATFKTLNIGSRVYIY
ncbi:MAG: L,D-transpeptidase [Bacteroidales bacterium]|nr:L,D-transpeptidase [Bacteroidales bacterium]